MGRRRKVVEQITAANEDKVSNASTETKSGVVELQSHAVNSNATEAINVKNHGHQISNCVVKQGKKSGVGSLVIRRSNRIKSLGSPTHILGVEPVVKHVDLVDDGKEQEPEIEQVSNPPRENGKGLEEKVDYLVTIADDFKSKLFGRQEEVSDPDISYKSMYINSQKKIEALMEDNYDLVRKLEFARGKIAAYEAMKDAVGATKEVLLVSALEKAANIAANLSPQAVQNCAPTPPASSPHGANDPKPKRTYNKRVRFDSAVNVKKYN